MSENKLRNREVIDAELQKTKAELAIAKHRQAKLLLPHTGAQQKFTANAFAELYEMENIVVLDVGRYGFVCKNIIICHMVLKMP